MFWRNEQRTYRDVVGGKTAPWEERRCGKEMLLLWKAVLFCRVPESWLSERTPQLHAPRRKEEGSVLDIREIDFFPEGRGETLKSASVIILSEFISHVLIANVPRCFLQIWGTTNQYAFPALKHNELESLLDGDQKHLLETYRDLIAGRITVNQLFTAGFLWNTVWSRSREQCLMRAYFRPKTTPSRFPVFCASVFFICSLYSPVDSSENRGQSYGIRSLLQGKRISCLVWDNLAQVTLGWNNCNDLVSHQVTGKPRSVCSKETR